MYGYLPFTYPPPFPPFSPPSLFYPLVTSFFTARVIPHENVAAAILSYAVSHLHEGTGKLRKTCADTVGHLTESVPSQQSLKNDLPLSVSMCRLAVTHPSTDPAKSCLTRVIAWHRTPNAHRTLSVNKNVLFI